MKTCVVYWIYDLSCKSILTDGYVGISNSLRRRHRDHIKASTVPPDSLCRMLMIGSRDYCFEIERRLRPTKGIGWNRAPGGEQGFIEGWILSKERKKQIGDVFRGIQKSVEHRQKLRDVQAGRKRPVELVDKSAAALRGRKYSTEHKKNISIGRIRIVFSNEHRRNLGKAVSASLKGKKKSAEHRLNISLGRRRMFALRKHGGET